MQADRVIQDGTFSNLQRAIGTIHSPAATSEHRRAAQQFLDAFKQQQNTPHDLYAYALMDQGQADEVRFFGFHLLEHYIRHYWDRLAPRAKEAVRSAVLTYLAQGTKDMTVEKRFIKEKAVSLSIVIASRDWPSQWPNFLNQLVEIAGKGETQLELILITLRDLVEEIRVYNDHLSDKRRREMTTKLKEALADIMAFFKKFIEQQYQLYLHARSSGQTTHQEKHAHLVSTVLTTVAAYLEWTPLELVMANNFPLVFSVLLQEPHFRMLACECLSLLVMSTKPDAGHIPPVLCVFEHMETIGKALFQRTDPEEDYPFQLKLSAVLSLLGQKHLQLQDNKKMPPFYEAYLNLMVMLAQHPSIQVNAEALHFWEAFLRSELTSQHGELLVALAPQILAICADKGLKLPYELSDADKAGYPPTLHATFEHIDNDFEDADAYVSLSGSVRGKVCTILHELTVKQPELALRATGELLQACMSSPISGDATNTTYSVVRFEYATLQVETAIRGAASIFTNPEQHATAITYVESLLGLLFNYKHTNPLLLVCVADAIKGFTAFYAFRPDSLKHILPKLLELVTFRPPEEQNAVSPAELSSRTLKARKKASTAFIHICDEIPQTLLPLLEYIFTMIGQIYAQGLLLEVEKANLVEALVAVSNAFNNFQQQEAFLLAVLKTPLEEWTSSTLIGLVSDVPGLLQFIGVLTKQQQAHITENMPSTVSLQQALGARKLHHLLYTFLAVARRASAPKIEEPIAGFGQSEGTHRHPLMGALKQVLPGLLALLRSIHTIWTPEVREQLPPAMHLVLDFDKQTASEVLGIHAGRFEEQPSNMGSQIQNAAAWLSSVRLNTYELLGRMTGCGEDFYSLGIDSILGNHVFVHLAHMQNRHLAPLLKNFVAPLVRNCPPRWFSVLRAVLPAVFGFVVNRLFHSWEELQRRNQIQTNSVAAELIEDKLLRDLTRDYATFMGTLFSEGAVKKGEVFRPSELVVALFSDEAVAVQVLRSFVGFVHFWPDSQSFMRMLPLARRLLTTLQATQLVHRPAIEVLASQELFGALLRSLHDKQTAAMSSAVILNTLKDLFTVYIKTPQYLDQVILSLRSDVVASFYQQQFKAKFAKCERAKEPEQKKVDLLKRLLWPLMGDNPKRHEAPSLAKPAVPSWLDTTDSFHLPM